MYIGEIFAILSMSTLALFMPCQMPLVFGRLLLSPNECLSPMQVGNLTYRIAFAVAEMWHFTDVILIGLFYGLYSNVNQIAVFWLRVRPLISSSGFGLLARKEYKKLAIWNKILNSSIKDRQMAVLICIIPMLQVLGASGFIQFHDKLPLIPILFLVFATLLVMILGFIILSVSAGCRESSANRFSNRNCR